MTAQSDRRDAVHLLTTKGFLEHFNLKTVRDLLEIEALEDAGLLGEQGLFSGQITPPVSSRLYCLTLIASSLGASNGHSALGLLMQVQ